jgi:hypothetical protein
VATRVNLATEHLNLPARIQGGPSFWFAFAAGHGAGVEEPGVVGADKPCIPGRDGDGRNVREPQAAAAAAAVLRAPRRAARRSLGSYGVGGEGAAGCRSASRRKGRAALLWAELGQGSAA